MHDTQSTHLTLMPEWAEIEAVVLAWPHEKTDWAACIDDARVTYTRLIQAINSTGAVVVLLCRECDIGVIKSFLSPRQSVLLVCVDYNDTWTRDYVFLTCSSEQGNTPVDFVFNGWGEKFNAQQDNLVNQSLSRICRRAMQSCPLVVEGGALEIDENQTLLSSASCLYNPKRNGAMSNDAYARMFAQYLGASKIVIFEYGQLEGDDTDGHIDTLVRFTPLMGIVMQHAKNRPADPHFDELSKLHTEIELNFPLHTIYTLPLTEVFNEKRQRLPASYANFLICNRHILAPIYQQEEDREALRVLANAFPNYKIIAIDCTTLIKQFGSLHCVTMQIPQETIMPDILENAKGRVTKVDL